MNAVMDANTAQHGARVFDRSHGVETKTSGMRWL
jgi:hypothetical protein